MRFGVRSKSVQNVKDVEDPEGGDDNGGGNFTNNHYFAMWIMPFYVKC